MFKGQGTGTGVSGRLCTGVVQVGEQLRILPGDEAAVVKCMSLCSVIYRLTDVFNAIAAISVDEESVTWAAAGSNATLYLTMVDPIHLNIGYVLCPPTNLVPLTSTFTARIIVFEIETPLTIGASVELFHHSYNVPATISKFLATLDKGTGNVIKKNPR